MASNDFPQIMATARTRSRLTAAEFDYSLATRSTLASGALSAIANACYDLANAGLPEVDETTTDEDLTARRERADALHRSVFGEIDSAVAVANAKSYTGWSGASGGPIRYAS